MRCRVWGLTLLLSTTMLVHTVAAQTQIASSSVRPAEDIITPGTIMLHRTESVPPPQFEATWEDKLKQSMAAAEQVLTAQTEARLSKIREENQRLQQQLTAQQTLVVESARSQGEAARARLQSIIDVAEARNTAAEARFAANQAQLEKVATSARTDVLALQQQTAGKLAEIRDAANQHAQAIVEARTDMTERKLAAALEGKTTPEQAKQLAREQLADAAPEMRALALQTLSDSQDYIKTVAKDAVKDGDPAVQEALQNAAKDVITKDNKVVFAMRQAMAKQIAAEAAGKPLTSADGTVLAETTSGQTPSIALGDALGSDIQIDAAGLQVTAPGAASATVPQILASLGGHKTSILPARNRRDWVDLRKYRVVVHEDGKTLEELLGTVIQRAEPFTGPWKIKWKISDENKDILSTKFSLDTETSFDEFVGYLAQYLINDRGVKVTFSLFDRDRVLVISD